MCGVLDVPDGVSMLDALEGVAIPPAPLTLGFGFGVALTVA